MSNEGFVEMHEKRFSELSVRVQQGEAYAAPLAVLVAELRKHSAVVDKSDPAALLEKVQGRLKVKLHACEMPEATLPNKLDNPANRKLVDFLSDSIRLIDETGAE